MSPHRQGVTPAALAAEILSTPTPNSNATPGIPQPGILKAVVASIQTGSVTLTFGTSTTQVPNIAYMASYTPLVNDAVWVLVWGHGDHLVIGRQLAQSADPTTTWTTATLTNSWVAFGGGWPAAGLLYRKDALGYVHIQGAVKSGTAGAAICTLPAGYRPGAYVMVMFNTGVATMPADGGSIGVGGVIVPPPAGGNTFLGVNTTFLAEN